MLTTLIFGTIQLVMFAILAAGITWWLACKLIGKPVSFTPQSLWEDHQQMIDQDPEIRLTRENKALLENLKSLNYDKYRRENFADRLYGF